MKKFGAGIIGGAGYTGGELTRLLVNHPDVELRFVQSGSNSGKPVHAVHNDLVGETDMLFSADFHQDVDVLFLCSGHGKAREFLQQNDVNDDIIIIDLGNDFRLHDDSDFAGRKFVYGLPEFNKEQIITAKNIANPGCFATAIQLGLLPLAKSGMVKQVFTTGITGSTGAGQSLSATSHFSWRQNNIQAYKTLTHQHLGEITESINQLQGVNPLNKQPVGDAIRFVPWRGDFARGIFISSTLSCSMELPEIKALYQQFYASAVFTHVQESSLFLKQVVNTNKCIIQLEKEGDTLVVHSAIDNLLKGASGQAVQNMNLMLGLDERAGLQLKASFF